jgi:heterodisulfide reductase subunit C
VTAPPVATTTPSISATGAPTTGTSGAARAPASDFLLEVMAATAGESRLDRCIQCGTCGGSCPSAPDMDHTPRALFAMIRAGLREEVLRSDTPWMCVSCYLCVVRCPQQVHITDVMYALKSIAAREGWSPGTTGAGFSRTFVANIRRYGRSYEVGLTAQHYLRHYPLRLPGLAPMGMGMLAKGRIGLRPHRIRDIRGLRVVLDRAAQLEAAA